MERIIEREFVILKGLLDMAAQKSLVDDIRNVVRVAPLMAPVTPQGREMSVRMTSAGTYGWVTDRTGYRYETRHPSGAEWPKIPASILEIWQQVSGVDRLPDSCLVNFYGEGARMGMHQDKDEKDFSAPVLSVSLGDDARFRLGGKQRKGPTQSVTLRSGDVMLLAGKTRMAFHGIDRIYPQTSGLLDHHSTVFPGGGRINLTLRRVNEPSATKVYR